MEARKEVKPIKVDYKCPKCDNGYLRTYGTVLTSYPPQYPHKCNNLKCDYVQNFSITYPYIDYEPEPIKYE